MQIHFYLKETKDDVKTKSFMKYPLSLQRDPSYPQTLLKAKRKIDHKLYSFSKKYNLVVAEPCKT